MSYLKGFKKVGQTDTHTVMRHPNGHEIHIAHQSVPEKQRKQLKQLPERKVANDEVTQRFAKGGMAAPVQIDPQNYAPASPLASAQAVLDPMQPDPSISDASYQAAPDRDTASYQNIQLPQAPQAPTNPDPFGYGSQAQQMGQGFDQVAKGIQDQGAATQRINQQAAAPIGNAVKSIQSVDQLFQKNMAQLQQEHDSLMSDYQNNHIDPNHFFGSMETPKKIATGIGLLLGGIGSGMTGQENPVIKMINSQIDRDIDAQKANMGQKKSLLEANHQMMGDTRDAATVTKANMLGIVEAQIQKAMLDTKSQTALPMMQQELGNLKIKRAELLQPVAARQALMQGVNGGQVDPSMAITALVPEHEQEAATKALGSINEIESFRKDLHSANKQLDGMTGHGLFSPNQRDAVVNLLAGKLSHVTAGRYNGDEAVKQINSLLHGRTDLSQGTQDLKNSNIDTLMDTLRAEHEPQLSRFGIRIPKASNTQDGFTSRQKAK